MRVQPGQHALRIRESTSDPRYSPSRARRIWDQCASYASSYPAPPRTAAPSLWQSAPSAAYSFAPCRDRSGSTSCPAHSAAARAYGRTADNNRVGRRGNHGRSRIDTDRCRALGQAAGCPPRPCAWSGCHPAQHSPWWTSAHPPAGSPPAHHPACAPCRPGYRAHRRNATRSV